MVLRAAVRCMCNSLFSRAGWVSGNYSLKCSLMSCEYTIDDAYSTKFSDMSDACSSVANVTIGALLVGYIGFLFCFLISIMFVIVDRCPKTLQDKYSCFKILEDFEHEYDQPMTVGSFFIYLCGATLVLSAHCWVSLFCCVQL